MSATPSACFATQLSGLPDVTSTAPGWWAIYTRHQHEKLVADTLLAKGVEAFLPVYHSIHQWKDRKKLVSLPLFPCYLFVRERIGSRLQIVTTPGVHMILSRGEQFAVLPDTEIQTIQRAQVDPCRVEPHPFLQCGDRVRVTRGPLEGVQGILLRKKNLFRLVLSVDMLAKSASVEIDAADIEPLDQREQASLSIH